MCFHLHWYESIFLIFIVIYSFILCFFKSVKLILIKIYCGHKTYMVLFQFFEIIKAFCGLTYGLSWWMCHGPLRRMCFMHYWVKDPIDFCGASWFIVLFKSSLYMLICLVVLYISENGILKNVLLLDGLSLFSILFLSHVFWDSSEVHICFQLLSFWWIEHFIIKYPFCL